MSELLSTMRVRMDVMAEGRVGLGWDRVGWVCAAQTKTFGFPGLQSYTVIHTLKNFVIWSILALLKSRLKAGSERSLFVVPRILFPEEKRFYSVILVFKNCLILYTRRNESRS